MRDRFIANPPSGAIQPKEDGMTTSPILAEPDPIFAAIEHWKEAIALENAAGNFEEIADQASDIRIKATYAIFEMVPTTLAGVRAKIDFAMSAQYARARP
jgi:hypothetical protein